MYVLTIVERAPTRPEEKDVNIHTIRQNTMQEVLTTLQEAEYSFTCWVSVTITHIQEENDGTNP